MNWPLKIDLPAKGPVTGTVFGERLVFEKQHDTLSLILGETKWTVALPLAAKTLMFGPALGPLPYLLFPSPTLVLPSGTEIVRTFRVPLHLDLAAAGSADARLRTIAPIGLTRSLYGPVDAGTICWSVRNDGDVSMELRIGGEVRDLSAQVRLSCDNQSSTQVDVSRIMIPTDMVGLYQVATGLRLSDVTMTVVGESDAELTMKSAEGGRALIDVVGQTISPVRRSFAFSHTYRNRTGLDYGF